MMVRKILQNIEPPFYTKPLSWSILQIIRFLLNLRWEKILSTKKSCPQRKYENI